MNIAVEKYNKITAIGVGTSNRTSHHTGNCSPNTIRCFQLRTACSDFIENYSKGRIIENITNGVIVHYSLTTCECERGD